MPQLNLISNSLTGGQSGTGEGVSWFKINVPAFLAGSISAATGPGSDPNVELVVEVGGFQDGNSVPDWLSTQMTDPTDVQGDMLDSLRGPSCAGTLKGAAWRAVRIRRIDAGTGPGYAFLDFREGSS